MRLDVVLIKLAGTFKWMLVLVCSMNWVTEGIIG